MLINVGLRSTHGLSAKFLALLSDIDKNCVINVFGQFAGSILILEQIEKEWEQT